MLDLLAKPWLLGLNVALSVAVLGGGVVAVALHEEPQGPCGPVDAETLAPRDVLDCLGDELGHVTTPVAAGSAVLLSDGRLLTNAHVVDPFAIDVTFRDGPPSRTYR